ncbi:MAG TPA: hypothetical protein VFD81_12230, partial [Methylomirabilota bacterium]|nr:hypothetical protein [Methylomirabilota bacterium]
EREAFVRVSRDRDLDGAAGTRASFALVGPLVGYGIDAWGLSSVLSALGVVFAVVFVLLLLPLVLRETRLGRAAASSA